MTQQEYNDLYDALYYGHDAELEVNNTYYFLEWNNDGIDIYILTGDHGYKITCISDNDKSEIVAKLFNYKFKGSITLNDSFAEINVVDIE